MFVGNLDIIKVAFDTTQEGIIISDSAGNIVFVNKAIEKNLGYSSEELFKENIDFFLPRFLHKIHKKHLNAYLNDPHYLSFDIKREIMGVHKNGKKYS